MKGSSELPMDFFSPYCTLDALILMNTNTSRKKRRQYSFPVTYYLETVIIIRITKL